MVASKNNIPLNPYIQYSPTKLFICFIYFIACDGDLVSVKHIKYIANTIPKPLTNLKFIKIFISFIFTPNRFVHYKYLKNTAPEST